MAATEKNSLLTALFLALFFTFALMEVPAEAEYSASASLRVREEYTDNVDLTSTDKKSEYITTINPDIRLDYKGKITSLLLNAGLNYYYYANDSQGDHLNFYGGLDSRTQVYKDIFFLNIFDQYSRVTIDQRRPVTQENVTVNLTDSNTLRANPYILYPLGSTLKARVDYLYTNQWYSSNQGHNYQDHTFSGSLIKELSASTSTFVTYSYDMHRYSGISNSSISDYDRQTGNYGIKFEKTRLLVEGSVGYTWFDFTDGRKTNDIVWNAAVQYKITELLSLRGESSQDFTDSVDAGPVRRLTGRGVIAYGGQFPVSVAVFNTRDTYLLSDRTDHSTGAIATGSIPFSSKMTGNIFANYTRFKFQPEDERVDRYGVGFSLAYAIRKATLSAGYTYNRNDSNIDQNDYTNNVIWLQIRVVYDI
ncbi:conserved exported hypothetical protein [Candidatus Sulfobium mesophilum]|uniref:PEP-CTERM system associated protein n=1 Tax=Candidatus Sulfobium mesophilum TaxID=2016548 RepID=A0A2U3QDT1_9BACT|nr:conserved exported hypothetical protein [Candidatus Sulfobium mesophilum]